MPREEADHERRGPIVAKLFLRMHNLRDTRCPRRQGSRLETSNQCTTTARLKFFDQIVRDSAVTGIAVKVAWRLVDRINSETGRCCPSQRLLASELSVDESTIRRAIALLIKLGWFTKTRHGRITLYSPNYGKRAKAPAANSSNSLAQAPGEPGTNDREKQAATPAEPTNEPVFEPPCAQASVHDPQPAGGPTASTFRSAIALWKARQAELIATVGEKDFKTWLEALTPESDDGETFVFAAITDLFVDHVMSRLRDILERALGRHVLVVKRSWASEAYTRRLAERAAISKANKVTDK